jgi:hypothetical protein
MLNFLCHVKKTFLTILTKTKQIFSQSYIITPKQNKNTKTERKMTNDCKGNHHNIQLQCQKVLLRSWMNFDHVLPIDFEFLGVVMAHG